MSNIYIDPRCALKDAVAEAGYTPETTSWTDICHSKELFAWIKFETGKHVGRWSWEPRKRKWVVYLRSKKIPMQAVGSYGSLDAARKAAAEKLAAWGA